MQRASYMPGDLINAAASVLRADSKRMLIHLMITNQDAFEKVRKFFKGVVVTIRPSGVRKKITNIVPRAGRQEFDKDGSIMTVAVRRPHNPPVGQSRLHLCVLCRSIGQNIIE